MQYQYQKIPNTKYGILNTVYRIRNTCRASRGFTLIETMVAIALLTISIVAPMSLTTQSLASAYYARDQITAFHLAQEAIESVRHVRDGNVLKNALGTPTDLLAGIPSGTPFTIDTTNDDRMAACSGTCQVLRKSNGGLYGYDATWTPTYFTRTATATLVPESNDDEINVTVTVEWKTGSFNSRTFTISENLFRWVSNVTGV